MTLYSAVSSVFPRYSPAPLRTALGLYKPCTTCSTMLPIASAPTQTFCCAVKHGKIQSFSPTPGHMDSLCSLMYLAAVSCLASAAFSQQRQKQQSRKRQNETLDSEEDIKRSWLRSVQLWNGSLSAASVACKISDTWSRFTQQWYQNPQTADTLSV